MKRLMHGLAFDRLAFDPLAPEPTGAGPRGQSRAFKPLTGRGLRGQELAGQKFSRTKLSGPEFSGDARSHQGLLAIARAGVALGVAAGVAVVAGAAPAAASSCLGNCGITGRDGVVTASPLGGDYRYVSTFLGVFGVGLGFDSDWNGSLFTSSPFAAAAGSSLRFFFNYITSDGGGFTDYAYVRLLNGGDPTILFTARTTAEGNVVPGSNLPPLAPGVVLTPATTPIIGGAPFWSPLGFASSGSCFGPGCGYTDWIRMDYTIPTAGTYTLEFGVVNWTDPTFQSGLAFDGIQIDGRPVDPTGPIPEPATWALMIAGFGLVGLAARRRRVAAPAQR